MTDKVFDQIMEIRSSGVCNMVDTMAVQNEAYKKGFFDLVVYIEEHKKEYVQFILYGKRQEEE
jgi:negative regulator of sigma E activity